MGLTDMEWVSRDYVPAGELNPGMAYLVRRILENTSQAGVLMQSRIGEDVEELLRPPVRRGDEPSYQAQPHASGFANTPLVRLHDPIEREAFAAALAETRARWGAVYPLLIGEAQVETDSLVPSISPSHPDADPPVGLVYRAGLPEAERAVEVANPAAPAWTALGAIERSRIGIRAAELLRVRKLEVAAWVVHEAGRLWTEALADVEEGIDHVEWAARRVANAAPRIDGGGYRPRGVVACIPPWNFPVALPAGMTAAALMAGNAVILKSAEATPIIAGLFVKALHDAGVPRDALVHLPGPGRTVGSFLVESPDIDMVTFTGSKAVGVRLYERAAEVVLRNGGVKRVIAEMGGKNAIVVLADADMDEAVHGIVTSAFGHAGQKCSACSRVLVHRDVLPRLRERLVEASRSLTVGPADDPGTLVNPVISKEALDGISAYVSVAANEGRLLLHGRAVARDSCAMGPVILELPEHSMAARIAQEEVFGPVLSIMPFESEREAVDVINATAYGLTLGIYSRSPRAIERVVRDSRAGNIYVNRPITGARVGIEPFGGMGLSGTGPKAGGGEYLWAFLTRAEGFRTAAPSEHVSDDREVRAALIDVSPWSDPLDQRFSVLQAGIGSMRSEDGTADLLESAERVLEHSTELSRRQPTVTIPGQHHYTRWDMALGTGLVAIDDDAPPASLAGLLAGALLAGNGVVVATGETGRPLAARLVSALHEAGVPGDSLMLAPPGTDRRSLAAGPVRFVASDLSLEATRELHAVAAVTHEDAGQRWLKALISVGDGPLPGEPGFLRQFAHPRVVAVQTIRHGAQLEFD